MKTGTLIFQKADSVKSFIQTLSIDANINTKWDKRIINILPREATLQQYCRESGECCCRISSIKTGNSQTGWTG